MKKDILDRFFGGRKVALLGFGQEGQSSFRTLRTFLPELPLTVCDKNQELVHGTDGFDPGGKVKWHLGPAYLEGLREADIIIRSPGVSMLLLDRLHLRSQVTSQTEIFLSLFREQISGITGTKGKSTTSSLLHHLLDSAGIRSILAGNIGSPVFDLIPGLDPHTRVVFEMSSHQLQPVRISPHMAVLLNLFPEHLDHYASFRDYGQAKLNICRWQHADDMLFVQARDPNLAGLMDGMAYPQAVVSIGSPVPWTPYFAAFAGSGPDLVMELPAGSFRMEGLARKIRLPGAHNLLNVAAAVAAAVSMGAGPEAVEAGVEGFGGLPHRLELVGTVNGVAFYNDSISTVPESTMAALRAFPKAASLILGGFDRGIDYAGLMEFIGDSQVRQICFLGDAGRRMHELAAGNPAFRDRQCLLAGTFEEAFLKASKACRAGDICLLSPAAASYDIFRDFRERGDRFRELVRQLAGTAR